MNIFKQSTFNTFANSKVSLLKWSISFFLLLSGCSALIYQVLWVRLLSLSIGSTSISISIVLAAFFLGMGLGSYFAGDILKRFKNPFKIYLLVEVGIALSAVLLLPILLNLDYYLSLLPFVEAGLGFRFFTVMLLLLIPTFLIGTTFPILMAVAITKKESIGSQLAHFYAVNTLGAVAGVLLSAMVFIPHFGLDGTLYIAVLLNTMIVIIGFILYNHFTSSLLSSQKQQEPQVRNNKALIVLFVTGFSAMATEVGWMKFLIIYTGNTIYGFSLILSMFLAGLAIGSWIAKSRLISNINDQKILFFGLLFLSIFLLGARIGLGLFPEIYEQINTWQINPFVYRWSKYLAMFLILLPATVFFGALFPIALKIYSPNISLLHSHVGKAYAVNIIAGIFGSLTAGFLIIPYFSTDLLLTGVSILVLFTSLFFINAIKTKKAYFIWVSFSIIFVVSSNNLAHLDYKSMIDIVVKRETRAAYYHSKTTTHYLKEGQTGVISIMSYDSNPCIMRLLNNGMNESWIDVCNSDNLLLSEFLLGKMPLLLNPLAKKAFVVGYGGGTTIKPLLISNLESIDIVELDATILDAVKTLYNNTLPTDTDERVNLSINDARNSLLMSNKTYDIIVSQPSHPWLNGASNIMNKDFFEIVKSRLSLGGINAQWVPLFKIDVATLKSIVRAYTDTFDYVISFMDASSNDLLLFGSNQTMTFDYESVQKQMKHPQISKIFNRHNIENPYDLMRYFALSREELVNISSSSIPATDTNLLAETFYSRYKKVKDNSFNTFEFLKSNINNETFR